MWLAAPGPGTGRWTRPGALSEACGRAGCWPAGPRCPPPRRHAFDLGALACAAQLLGAGRALLEASVRHARHGCSSAGRSARSRRSSTSSPTWRSAWSSPGRCSTRPRWRSADRGGGARDVSAAKVACADAAAAGGPRRAAGARRDRLHAEHDLSLWLAKVRALSRPGAARPSTGRGSWRAWPRTAGRHGADREQRALRDAVRGLLARHRAPQPAAGRPALRPGAVAAAVRRDRRGRAGRARAIRRRRGGPGRDQHRRGGTRPEPGPRPLLGSAVLATQALLASRRHAPPASGCCRRSPPGPAIAALAWTPAAGHWDPAEVGLPGCPRGARRRLGAGRRRRTTCWTATRPTCCWSPRRTPDGIGLFEVDPRRGRRHPRGRHRHGPDQRAWPSCGCRGRAGRRVGGRRGRGRAARRSPGPGTAASRSAPSRPARPRGRSS